MKKQLTMLISTFNITLLILQFCEFLMKKQPSKIFRKGTFKKVAKCKGKHLRRGLFFNRVAGWRDSTLLK